MHADDKQAAVSQQTARLLGAGPPCRAVGRAGGAENGQAYAAAVYRGTRSGKKPLYKKPLLSVAEGGGVQLVCQMSTVEQLPCHAALRCAMLRIVVPAVSSGVARRGALGFLLCVHLQENPDLFKWLTGQQEAPSDMQANPAFAVCDATCSICLYSGSVVPLQSGYGAAGCAKCTCHVCCTQHVLP